MAAVLDKGHGALLYDAMQPAGPDSTRMNSPGQWKEDIAAFNAGATKSTKISRLYPYSGDIEMYCTGLNDDCIYSGSKKNVFVYYTSPAGYGKDSVAAYRKAFPKATIMPIIDGHTQSSLLKAINYSEIGKKTADLVARSICVDPNVDGVLFDLEPLDIRAPGQVSFYTEISRQFASASCIDANHPRGRVFGALLNPHIIRDWHALAVAFGGNGYAAVSAYDVNVVQPVAPVNMKIYTRRLIKRLKIMDKASKKYKIPYTVIIPAASSYSEFNKIGVYDSRIPPPNFIVKKDYTSDGVTQIGYMKAARAIMMAHVQSSYFIGTDYWSWSQYKSPDPKKDHLLFPAIPEGDVVTYLQQYGEI